MGTHLFSRLHFCKFSITTERGPLRREPGDYDGVWNDRPYPKEGEMALTRAVLIGSGARADPQQGIFARTKCGAFRGVGELKGVIADVASVYDLSSTRLGCTWKTPSTAPTRGTQTSPRSQMQSSARQTSFCSRANAKKIRLLYLAQLAARSPT